MQIFESPLYITCSCLRDSLAKMNVIITCLAVLFISPNILVAAKQFDFYKISLQWPKTYCDTQPQPCKTPIINHFTIHGLWPQYSPDQPVPPFNQDPSCTTEKTPTPPGAITEKGFKVGILEDMNHYWPDVQNYQNLSFWRHEWRRHGMCWKYPTDYARYFSAALDFTKQHDLLAVLGQNGIRPGTSTDQRNFSNAIKGAVGKTPQVACKQKGKVRLLFEVRVCFDKNETPQDCPVPFSNCGVGGATIQLPVA